jgi:ankyrin repeat protein
MMSKASGVSSEISAEASSALAKAAAAGQTRVVRELLNRPEVDMNFRVPELEGQTALHRASLNGHLEIVELLLKHGALLEVTDDKGITPLLGAAGAGELIVFKVLEKSGGDVNAVAEDGQTVLHIAAAGDSLSVLNHLALSSKLIHTLSNRTKDGRTALLCAVQDSSLDTAYSIFHKSSRSEILSKTNDGHTCLHYAVLSGNLRMIALFQDVGICYHDQTTEGFTALHYAAIEGNFETNEIQTLIFCAILDHIDDVTLTAQDIFACPNLIDTRAHLQFPDGTWVIDDFISGRRIDIPTNSGKTVVSLDPNFRTLSLFFCLPFSILKSISRSMQSANNR